MSTKRVKEYKRHVYDLELKSMLLHYASEIRGVELKGPKKDPEYYTSLVEFAINEHCKFNKINFKLANQILIHPEVKDTYYYYLGISLMFYPVHKISQYLNYQQKAYDKISGLKYPFVNAVEFVVADIVAHNSPFDNSARLDTIMKWVASVRYMPVSQKKIVRQIMQHKQPVEFLVWNGDQALLKKLSKNLKTKKYTARTNDFQNIFKNKKNISWLGSLPSWVYLMYKLTQGPDNLVTTSRGKKPYFKVGEQYFEFVEQEKTKKIVYSNILIEMTKRNKNKHKQIIDSIDFILKTIQN